LGADSHSANGLVACSYSETVRTPHGVSTNGVPYPTGDTLTLIEEAICELSGPAHRTSRGLRHEPNIPLLRRHRPARPTSSTSLGLAAAFVNGQILVTVQPGWLRI